ncbi:MAG: hypothetical protein GX303_02105 [Clostridiales bacterium]|nr:hypothetical protein [Clostridiales bacterium]
MTNRRGADWSRLDNAAKIFPPTSSRRDPRVFRFSCELYEQVDPEILQHALDAAVSQFPNFLYILKRGLFWYYLERSDLKPVVALETDPPCSKIYSTKSKTLLFDVTYYKKRINLEVYHVLSDGTGALQFLLSIVYHYLLEKYRDELPQDIPILMHDASFTQKTSDSFEKYYNKTGKTKRTDHTPAYNIRSESFPNYGLNIITGIMPLDAVIAAAKRHNAILTVFLSSLLMLAIREEMRVREMRRPISLGVPVNLRRHFPSATARNFFGIINVRYDFSKGSGELSDIIAHVDAQFKDELTRERLAERMNALSALEHNFFIRIAPLALKNIVLRIAGNRARRKDTMVFSNVGKVELPKPLAEYVRLFDVFTSTYKIQLCMCSFENVLNLTFSSTLVGTEIEKNFFRLLRQQIEEFSDNEGMIEIRSNRD